MSMRPVLSSIKAFVQNMGLLLVRKPVSGLQPERLYLYLDSLWRNRDIKGAVVEVGCFRGGTAAIAFRMLQRTGHEKMYVCIDTFEGFVPEHMDHDVSLGTQKSLRGAFATNSLGLVRKLLKIYRCDRIELVKGNICTLPVSLIPPSISVALVDVDLDIPTYAALRLMYPRISKGGVILVDDCPEDYGWRGARIGYERFVKENSLREQYCMGMGILRK